MKYKSYTTVLIILILSVFTLQVFSQTPRLTMKEIMADPPIEGNRPSNAAFSDDAEWISYSWQSEEDSSSALWIVNSDGSGTKKLLDNFRGFYRWMPNSGKILFSQKSDFYLIDADTGEKERLTEKRSGADNCIISNDGKFIVFANKEGIRKMEIESKEHVQLTTTRIRSSRRNTNIEFSPDGKKVSYTKDNNIYVIDLKTKENELITDLYKVEDETKDPRLGRYYWSPDCKYIVYTTSTDNNPHREAIVPRYLGKYVTGRRARNSFAGDKFSDTGVYVIEMNTYECNEVDTGEFKRFSVFGIYWAKNSKYFVFSKLMENFKERYLLKVNPETCAASILDYEKDDTWLGSMASNITIYNKDKDILITSERSGYNHIYRIPAKGGSPKQLTSGNWEVNQYYIHPDSDKVIYVSTEKATEERHIYKLDLKKGKREKLKTEEGMNTRFSISKNGNKILYSHMNVDFPLDYYLIDFRKNSKPVRITNSIPEKFKKIKWIRPEFISYPNTEDGVPVKARLYLPEKMEKNKKYPLIIFIHGAGSLQNVVKGWEPYTPNIKWHTRLVEKGYIVLDPDYRHSTGYGRDFRTGIYGFMGGKDLSDVVSGIEYLKSKGYIDENRVGVYGGSYGGFLTLMALCIEPDYFTCGAALRSVTDWKNYNAWYTNSRLGTPEGNPEAYKKSSPVNYAEQLTRPLLLIHGLVDDNVFSQDSFQFAEKLIQAGIPFEFMIYPSQSHGFNNPESWTDEYRRIEEFFDEHLME